MLGGNYIFDSDVILNKKILSKKDLELFIPDTYEYWSVTFYYDNRKGNLCLLGFDQDEILLEPNQLEEKLSLTLDKLWLFCLLIPERRIEKAKLNTSERENIQNISNCHILYKMKINTTRFFYTMRNLATTRDKCSDFLVLIKDSEQNSYKFLLFLPPG